MTRQPFWKGHQSLQGFFVFVLVFIYAICWGDMAVYLKDGTSLNVLKIVFRQNLADLYFPDGSMRTYPIDKIDLKSSGIPRPEGTYGQTRLSPNTRKKPAGARPLVGDPRLRQALLREEWEHADQSAMALNNIGPISQGSIVRISNQSASGTDSEFAGVIEEAKDDAFIVIFVNPNGLFGKKLFDAATFHSNFKMNEKSVEPSTPIVPQQKTDTDTIIPQQPEKELPPEPSPAPETVEPEQEIMPTEKPAANIVSQESDQSFPAMPVMILAGIAVAGGALFVYSRKRKKPFLNVSRFKQFEEELRDFELEIWLKHGRTTEQLMEICTKKFYQDQPNSLTVAMKMLKGADRQTIVHSISRQGNMSFENAEAVYLDMQQRMEWIRRTINDVSARTGHKPLEHSSSPSIKIVPEVLSLSMNQDLESPKPAATKVETPDAEISPSPVIFPPVSQPSRLTQTSTAGLPLYLRNVLKHLGDLSD